jgi:hypothetical protein
MEVAGRLSDGGRQLRGAAVGVGEEDRAWSTPQERRRLQEQGCSAAQGDGLIGVGKAHRARRTARKRPEPKRVGDHTLRAAGVTFYLENGETLEKATGMANLASSRTT